MSRILFIVHDLHQDDNHFPVGIAILSAVLKREGHEVRALCCDVFHYSDREIKKELEWYDPDVVGIGFLAARFIESVVPLCELVKRTVRKDTVLVLGGHGATGCPKYVKELTGCDYVVCGEGEEAICSIAWRTNVKDISSNPPDLNSLPFPAYSLFPVDIYKRQLKLPGWQVGDFTLGVSTSRGCKGKCSFCQRLSKGLRFRDMNLVCEELRYLYDNYGINYFFFQDEMFVSSEKRMRQFHDGLVKFELLGKVKWGGDSRVDVISPGLLDLLKLTNVQFLDFGFESMDADVLKKMGKGTTPDMNDRCAEMVKNAKIPFNMNILWGLPGDSLESLEKNMAFIRKYNDYKFLRTIRPPTPYPGCPLFDKAVKEGKLKGPDDFFRKFRNSDLLTVNFTDLEDNEFYYNLWLANSSLIRMYYRHQASRLKERFYQLYFMGDTGFRGARHYG